ncbi:hypothetical protein HID58_038815, partial [Brassica napus]
GPYTSPPPIGYPTRDAVVGDPRVSSVETKSKVGFSYAVVLSWTIGVVVAETWDKALDLFFFPFLSLFCFITDSSQIDDVSSDFSVETEDRNRGRLSWSSRSLVPLASSSPSEEVPKATTDDDSVGVDDVSSVSLTISSI